MLYMIGTLALDTRPFGVDSMSRDADASVVAKPLIGSAPAKEFTGDGEDDITLTGQLVPSRIGGMDALETLHQMRRSGTRFPLMRGDAPASAGTPSRRSASSMMILAATASASPSR